MCSTIILRRPGHRWPVIIGGNRDEMLGRPWRPPARHWPDRPEVVAGLDELAGGSWFGVNDHGVVAAVLNRHGALGPKDGKRSRGELVLEALDHADADEAARALADLNGLAWRSFNMIIADNRDAYWLSLPRDAARVHSAPLPEGLSMLTAFDLNDPACPRTQNYLPLFKNAAPPDPDTDSWYAWQELLASAQPPAGTDPHDAMSIRMDTAHGEFGTSSSALLALPSAELIDTPPVFLFRACKPRETEWEKIKLA